ncbi:hypothetical protein EQH50_05435 [Klebsiella quasipneumoniae]|nr:hypothetical protein EQH50_05435 [Klebsiella quasipneumoniae]
MLHKIMAAKPIVVALFFSMLILRVTRMQPAYISSFDRRGVKFSAMGNPWGLVKTASAGD